MPTLHHVNLGIPPDRGDAEAEFLVGILGYRRLERPKPDADFGARWFEADDGTQVHLSLDPEHTPAAMAHTALHMGADGDAIATRLSDAGVSFKEAQFDGVWILLCQDPAGNRWGLRS